MRFLIAIIVSISSISAFAIDRGINYDPAHNPAFTQAQRQLNIQTMRQLVQHDLDIIQNAGFTAVKTFYSNFATIDGKHSFNAADVVCPMNLKLYLGVYEFNPDSDNCADWCKVATQQQVQYAIDSAKKYPNCIEMIIVGNEDIYNWDFSAPNNTMQQRISNDIATIKSALPNRNIVITSAQQDGAWLKLSKNDPYEILNKIDTIGVNIYPFWSAQQPNVSAAKSEFIDRLNALENIFPGKFIIITEEGWPSSSSANQNPNATIEQAKEYYGWWQSRAATDSSSSIYFTMFDKQPTNLDADNYFGLCTYDQENKIINQCQ